MKVFDYEHIQLIPKKCIVSSRKECDASIQLGKRKFKIPVVPANMKTILDENLAVFLAENDYFYVMHRFEIDNVEFTKRMKERGLFTSISLGVKEIDYKVVDRLTKEGLTPEYITIDIAHGHSNNLRDMIKYIKEKLPETFIIAGNVSTPDAVIDLENWGADAIKVGIGPGKVCITRFKTGFGSGGWQLSALKWCAKVATKPLIADGGLRHNGDIAKSIRFGATMCMVGSMFAGHEESPGELVVEDGIQLKEYYGSASEFNKGERKNVEGKKILVDYRGPIIDTLIEMEEDIQSSISYAGGNNIDALRKTDYLILKY